MYQRGLNIGSKLTYHFKLTLLGFSEYSIVVLQLRHLSQTYFK